MTSQAPLLSTDTGGGFFTRKKSETPDAFPILASFLQGFNPVFDATNLGSTDSRASQSS